MVPVIHCNFRKLLDLLENVTSRISILETNPLKSTTNYSFVYTVIRNHCRSQVNHKLRQGFCISLMWTDAALQWKNDIPLELHTVPDQKTITSFRLITLWICHAFWFCTNAFIMQAEHNLIMQARLIQSKGFQWSFGQIMVLLNHCKTGKFHDSISRNRGIIRFATGSSWISG